METEFALAQEEKLDLKDKVSRWIWDEGKGTERGLRKEN